MKIITEKKKRNQNREGIERERKPWKEENMLVLVKKMEEAMKQLNLSFVRL
jgi:hypothetical protein